MTPGVSNAGTILTGTTMDDHEHDQPRIGMPCTVLLYLAALVGGIGVCAVTASTFSNAFKWSRTVDMACANGHGNGFAQDRALPAISAPASVDNDQKMTEDSAQIAPTVKKAIENA
jgi:hypothetical protein